MVCAKCLTEYIEGIQVCVDCHVKLVEELSWNQASENGNGKLVHFITCFTKQEAECGRKLLAAHRIEAVVSMDEIRGVRLWIPREDTHQAIQVFQAQTAAAKNSQKTV